MKLQQIRFILAISQYDLNISNAAKHLYTSQPGVSRQLRLLEEELGTLLFVRNGKQLVDITEHGKVFISKFKSIMELVGEIKSVSKTLESEKFSLSNGPQMACA
jgi:LysR family cys regulon transcriptional activator